MAVIKSRLKRKNTSEFDVYYLESSADMILRTTGATTVESSLATLESSVSNLSSVKANKVTGATANNFAGLDSSGNLIDSGKKTADFATANHKHTVSQITGGTASKVPVYTSGGVLSSSAVTASELGYLTGVTSAIQTQFTNISNKFASYILTSQKGVVNGVVPLGSDSKISSTYLPSYVDDVIEGYYKVADGKFYHESGYTTLITDEAGKIYVDLSTNKTYRWTGSVFVEISPTQVISASSTNGDIKINGTDTTVYTHPSYAGTHSGASTAVSAGGSFNAIDSITLSNGHISAYETRTYTIPAAYVHPTYSTTHTVDGTHTLAHGDPFTVMTAITISNGHVSEYHTKTFNLPGYDWVEASSQPTTQKTGDFWLEAI